MDRTINCEPGFLLHPLNVEVFAEGSNDYGVTVVREKYNFDIGVEPLCGSALALAINPGLHPGLLILNPIRNLVFNVT